MASERHCDRQDASRMSTQERRKKDMTTDAATDAGTGTLTHSHACRHHAATAAARATHAHGYGLNDGHDGANVAAALVTAAAVILCASGMLDVIAMDTIIIAMLVAVMTSMLHASRDRTYGMRHDKDTICEARGNLEATRQASRAAIDRCCAYCLYILLWTGTAMLYVLSEGSEQGMLPTAVTLSATLTAFVTTLAARRHVSDTQGDARR